MQKDMEFCISCKREAGRQHEKEKSVCNDDRL